MSVEGRKVQEITVWVQRVDGREHMVTVWNDKMRSYVPLFATDGEDEQRMDDLARAEAARQAGQSWYKVKFIRVGAG